MGSRKGPPSWAGRNLPSPNDPWSLSDRRKGGRMTTDFDGLTAWQRVDGVREIPESEWKRVHGDRDDG